jgi:ABC-type phosphate/phosphonate transport system substrate-binding protein
MFGQKKLGLTCTVLAIGLGGEWTTGVLEAEREANRPAIRIGLIGSLFRDLPGPLVKASMGPFRTLMETQTGLRGDLVTGGDAFTVAEQLNADKLQLGVFHGFEFAWVREKYPKLRPLMIAVNQDRHLSAHLLVSKDSEAKNLADLKGKSLAVPSRTKEHCHLFLERSCRDAGKTPKEYFSQIHTPGCVEDALDDVVDGKVQAVLVDNVSLQCYKRRKPGRFGKLKEVGKSTTFPATVVVYHLGAVDKDTLRRFQEGMTNAGKTAYGRQLMALWMMTGFEPVPDDFEQNLKAIATDYPAPKKIRGVK